ncbi:Smr/MutS family protein [Fusobacterium necrophorum]|uniref:Smr/MutS family protein n=1 Tax=Fusobacterium necrophorum TaxID=859 RepID=UPI00370F6DDD
MYKEIDLHGMNYEDALRIFIQKYNEMIRKKEKKEICVIHGYGSKRLDSSAVLQEKLRKFLSKQKGKLFYRVDLNPGVTYVMPIMLLEERGKRKK